MANPLQTSTAPKCEATLVRVINAPRERVFRAWVDARQLAQWWGPKGFTNPVCEVDARHGGRMRIDMRAPDGTVYPMTGIFREIIAPERLVFLAVAEDHHGNPLLESLTTVTFEDLGAKTRLTVHASAVGIADVAAQMLAGMEEGGSGSLDRLGALF